MSRWFGGFRPPPQDLQRFERERKEREQQEREQQERKEAERKAHDAKMRALPFANPPSPSSCSGSSQLAHSSRDSSPPRSTAFISNSPEEGDHEQEEHPKWSFPPVEAEAPVNLLKLDYEQWQLTSAFCTKCRSQVPHNQLYVCTNNACDERCRFENNRIDKPTDFYTKNVVFCGSCSFRGCHEHHSSSMVEANVVAIRLASESECGGAKIAGDMDALRIIDDEEPVDYIMSLELKSKELPRVPVVEYLNASLDSEEWNKKKSELEKVCELITGFRKTGSAYVRDKAKEALTVYEKLRKAVDVDLNQIKPEHRDVLEFRRQEHLRNMGAEVSTIAGSGDGRSCPTNVVDPTDNESSSLSAITADMDEKSSSRVSTGTPDLEAGDSCSVSGGSSPSTSPSSPETVICAKPMKWDRSEPRVVHHSPQTSDPNTVLDSLVNGYRELCEDERWSFEEVMDIVAQNLNAKWLSEEDAKGVADRFEAKVGHKLKWPYDLNDRLV